MNSTEKRIINWKNDADEAFRKMAESIRRENESNVDYRLLNDGAYEVRME